jgi:signal transduction histidine kinase
MTSDVIVVNDSETIDALPYLYHELIPIKQVASRSWVLSMLGDVVRGLGYVWIGMSQDAREWSDAEIGFVRRIISDSSQILANAWMISQSMEIAANDAEVERLVELGKVKNSFIENMNHELRTPLTSIIGYLEVIMDDVDVGAEPELVSSLTAVQRNALRLQILIENMMQISKTDFEHVPLVVTTVDVGHLLGDVVSSLQLGAEDGGVVMSLRLDSPAGDLIIDGDVNQLEQVFVNLLSNAIKFTPRDGSVTVVARRVHADGDCVEVKVADTGIGIPAKEFPNVFQRFFRASTATQASIPGFGIGLSLVNSIVSEHNGTVAFDSTVGKGTVFTVTLPTRQRSSRKPRVTV